ncbi:MAG: signal peptidase II [Chloroflexi bacterium]|nr:signal peptidase II [Chloroflexota bacterium]
MNDRATTDHVAGRATPLRGLLFLGLAIGVVAFDQWAKQVADATLLQSGIRSVPIPYTGGLLRFTYVENRGAAFGLFQDQTVFFVVVGLVVVGVIAASYRYLPRSGFLVHLALGLQLGGAVGNLVDRVRQGYVIDYVDFGYQQNWFPVFNVADSAITVGVVLLALHYLRSESARTDGANGSASVRARDAA